MANANKITRFLWDGTTYTFQDERVDGLAKVASSGSYADLEGTPVLDSEITDGATGIPTSAAVRAYLKSQLEAIENGSY